MDRPPGKRGEVNSGDSHQYLFSDTCFDSRRAVAKEENCKPASSAPVQVMTPSMVRRRNNQQQGTLGKAVAVPTAEPRRSLQFQAPSDAGVVCLPNSGAVLSGAPLRPPPELWLQFRK
mmetsp:Transcript_31755/g.73717  ORF Transcript_31755/g.73717 Transcript_31755/m.73717 type:complete len:118 (+) Transcript_31755:68-421(+)